MSRQKESMWIIALAIALVLAASGTAFAAPGEWSRCMARCQAAHDRMDPAHALWRKAFSELLEGAMNQIESKWEVRDRVLGLGPSSLKLQPHFDIKGDDGKSLERFKSCVTICGKP